MSTTPDEEGLLPNPYSGSRVDEQDDPDQEWDSEVTDA